MEIDVLPIYLSTNGGIAHIMGSHRHGQEGALAPLWKCCKVFCAL